MASASSSHDGLEDSWTGGKPTGGCPCHLSAPTALPSYPGVTTANMPFGLAPWSADNGQSPRSLLQATPRSTCPTPRAVDCTGSPPSSHRNLRAKDLLSSCLTAPRYENHCANPIARVVPRACRPVRAQPPLPPSQPQQTTSSPTTASLWRRSS